MQAIKVWKKQLENHELDLQFQKLSLLTDEALANSTLQKRFVSLLDSFMSTYSSDENTDVGIFSAPGRTELLGNHTDHQGGHVIAAAVNIDAWACAAFNQQNIIRFQSKGWDLVEIDLGDLQPQKNERETTAALLRGIAANFVQKGYAPKGLNIYCQSDILPGSGLSSSAAIEVLIGVILNHLWADDQEDAVSIAKIGQYAENEYFGKPSGLMDQMSSSVGSTVHIDFSDAENVKIEVLDLNLAKNNFAICSVDSGADHSNLTSAYASIPEEMKAVAVCFDKELLSQIPEQEFFNRIKLIRGKVGDRAILRAIHFYQENRRVLQAAEEIKKHDFLNFLKEIQRSGNSSWTQLQNISLPGSSLHQEMAFALSISGAILSGAGAYRVQGGGFAGAIQAFVPLPELAYFKSKVETILGENTCHEMQIRDIGGYVFQNKTDSR